MCQPEGRGSESDAVADQGSGTIQGVVMLTVAVADTDTLSGL